MTDSFRLVGGSSVSCEDGTCGVLCRIILDPGSKTISHLAVEPKDPFASTGRLVPIGCVLATNDEIRLRCTKAEFDAFAPDEVYLTSLSTGMGMREAMTMSRGAIPGALQIIVHQIPDGEIEINSAENIRATDGPAGHLRGITIDANDFRITHLLLRVGHLLGKKDVSIPIEMVLAIDSDQMTLSLTKAKVSHFR